jgi:hypothetical protein
MSINNDPRLVWSNPHIDLRDLVDEVEEERAAAADPVLEVHPDPELERDESRALVLALASAAYKGTLIRINYPIKTHDILDQLIGDDRKTQDALHRIASTKILLLDGGAIFIPPSTGDFYPIVHAADTYFDAAADAEAEQLENLAEAVAQFVPEEHGDDARTLAQQIFHRLKRMHEAPEA